MRTLLGKNENIRLTVLDRLTATGDLANLDSVRGDDRLAFVHGDVCDPALVNALVAQHDEVVHFAAESHAGHPIPDAAEFVRTNVSGTQVLLDAALRTGLRTFVHVSTYEVYGSAEDGPWPETQPLAPCSPYAATRAAGDLLALSYHRTYGLDVRVSRCSSTYGHHQSPHKPIPLIVSNLLRGAGVPLYGGDPSVRDWLHIDDHVQGIELVRVAGRPGEVYNIGGGTELTLGELTGLLLEACGAGVSARWDAEEFFGGQAGRARHCSVDWTKIRTELGYRPAKDIETGLAETVAWYRENRGRWTPPRRSPALDATREPQPARVLTAAA
ncbi:dTDP-glucose 4,6-dehydratase [Nonomuraea jiangxiensis]|uniref:dTDP-glucose 4,6-dehydratase n=1 Tax=Nonomuraea jiangxiensis TaxID=633440 RepID=UPI001FEC5529|nr:GDP-mannose 4,6-dehydratase [Nonomuraea jiangxiensis]